MLTVWLSIIVVKLEENNGDVIQDILALMPINYETIE